MPRRMTAFAALAVLVYLGLCAALFVLQRSLIYLPQPCPSGAAARAVPLDVDGARVLVTVRERPGREAVIYFGGNAETVPLSEPELAAAFPARALYLPHYRGYCGSGGNPSEEALLADAQAVYDMVRASHDDIVVVGRSLGSAVAVHLAASRPVTGLVLLTPFDSLETVATRHYPFFPVRLLLRDRFDSRSRAPQVPAPTLILAAEHDEIVPRASTENLLAAFRPGLAKLVAVPGTGHNTVPLSAEDVGKLDPGR
jgi:pimeloyl-ACP methyl ester carboxylesterase